MSMDFKIFFIVYGVSAALMLILQCIELWEDGVVRLDDVVGVTILSFVPVLNTALLFSFALLPMDEGVMDRVIWRRKQ